MVDMASENVGKPKKDDHTVRLTSFYTELAKSISGDWDMAFAEVLTKACERGLTQMADDHKTHLVREKLKRRLAGEALPDGHDD